MRRLIRQVHAYVGLVLSFLLLVFAITGSALVYKEAFWRLTYPELRIPQPQLTPDQMARAFASAEEAFGSRLRSIKLPEPGVPALHLYLESGEAFLSAENYRVIDEWGVRDRPMAWLFDLHAHLMAGESGEIFGGWISLLGVLLAVTGLVLWWPARRQFRWRNLLPLGWHRRDLIAWHRDLGLVFTPLLLVLLLSAAGLVFYTAAGTMLNALFGDESPAVFVAEAPPVESPPLADAAVLEEVERQFPDARIVFYYPAREGNAFHEFRLKQPCELHPNGRSYLYVSLQGEVMERIDPCLYGPGEKVLHSTYPLHAGKADSQIYKFLVFLGGLVLAALAGSGFLAYARKLGWIRQGSDG